jgi:MutL protein
MSLDEGAAQRDPDVRIQTLRQAQPDIVLIAGGADGGAARPVLDLAQVVALYNQVLEPGDRPLTFYAGNARLAGAVTALFSGGGELRSVPNVRPRLNRENLEPLQSELDTIYQERWLAQVPGFDVLSEWSGGPVLPAAHTFGQTIHYIGDR